MIKFVNLSSCKKTIFIILAAVVFGVAIILLAIFIIPGLLTSSNQSVENDIKSYIAQLNTDLKYDYVAENELLDYLHETYTLEITSINKDESGSIAQCKISSPDMTVVLDEVYQELETQDAEIFFEDVQKLIMMAIRAAPFLETDVAVTLIAGENDQVIPEISEALLDAIYGGLISYAYDFLK